MRLFENAKYDFLGKRRITYAVCAAIFLFALLPGLFYELTRGSWFNWAVDFTGGTLVQVRFKQSVSEADLRELVEPVAPGAEISRFGGHDEFLIRAGTFAASEGNVSDRIFQVLKARFGDQYEVIRTDAVGPKVGNELKSRATMAVLLSFAATLIYLAFRLEWSFGVAAIIATINDIIFTLGVLASLRLEFSLTTVAALLTIIGYSLNDKIVVFDRVRENLKATRRREEFGHLINRSINETLPRTVMTGGSVLAVLLVLFLVGGMAIRDFALIMFLGIVVGTFSSMFLAPAVLVAINQRWPKESKKRSVQRATA
jgi:preprotein translocase subunit SecF